MNKESSQLLASTRPQPTGQDSHDVFLETDDGKHNVNLDEGKLSALSSGTPRRAGVVTNTEPTKTNAATSAYENLPLTEKKLREDKQAAPLGFEPEGSVARSDYLDGSSSDLLTLLHTSDGRHLFRDFLVQSHQEGLLNCWLACYNYRSNVISWSTLQQAFDRYIIHGDYTLPLQDATRSAAEASATCNTADLHAVDGVERELWSALNSEWYRRFVNSNYYVAYCKRMELPKRETRSRKPDLHTLLEGKPAPSSNPQALQNTAAVNQPFESMDVSHGQGSNVKASSRWHNKNTSGDNLPVPMNFVPITQKASTASKRALPPDELMRQLIPKLEVLSLERAMVNMDGQLAASSTDAERSHHYSDGKAVGGDAASRLSGSTGYTNPKESHSCGDAASFYSGPSYGRYSVAGASSRSCPDNPREPSRKYKDGAKELASAVHQALRTKLHSSDFHSGDSSITTPSCQSSSRMGSGNPHRQCCCGSHTCKNVSWENEGPPVPAQPATNHRIMEWMEKNAEHAPPESESSFAASSLISSPSVHRRHRHPVAYNTSRGSSKPHASSGYDHRNEHERSRELHGKSHHKSSRSHRHQSNNAGYQMGYPESATSGNWTASDSASSYLAASVVSSSVPSTASRLWPETKFDFHQYENSGTCRSGSSRKSTSTGNNSHSCKSSNSTMVTYYLEKEPIPYRSTLSSDATLAEFKKTVAKKGTFRYFFKTMSHDDDQVVYQEITNDDEMLPRYKKNIVVKVKSQ